jgi:hypothetical protein
VVALAFTVIAWPVSALVRRRYGVACGLSGTDARAHRRVRIASLVVLATVIAWVILMQLVSSDFDWASPAMDTWFIFLRLLSLVVFFAGAAIALWNAWAVLRSQRKWLAKLWSVVLAIACLVVLYVGLVFHLVGYSANY